MKKSTILLFIGICFTLQLSAQKNQHETENKLRFIEVVGIAEMKVSPDTLTLSICLREKKEENNRKSLADLEKELKKDLDQLGIHSEELTVADIGGVWREGNSKGRKPQYFLTKTFSLKLGSIEQVDKLLATINRENIDHIQIASLSNRKTKEYQQQTRVEALEAAKEKADFLLKSQGKELGEIIFIIEQEANSPFYRGQQLSNVLLSYGNNSEGNIESFRKINLHYNIKVRFAIR